MALVSQAQGRTGCSQSRQGARTALKHPQQLKAQYIMSAHYRGGDNNGKLLILEKEISRVLQALCKQPHFLYSLLPRAAWARAGLFLECLYILIKCNVCALL